MRGWMEGMYEHGRRSVYPCQSTGLWYVRDATAAAAFLDGLVEYLREKPNEWEQKAFQLLVMRYLVGLGDELPPLRYRLLPTARYINVEMYEERLRAGLPTADTVGVHCGYLKTMGDKLEHLDANGLLERGLAAHARLVASLERRGAPPAGSYRTTLLHLRRKNRSRVDVLV